MSASREKRKRREVRAADPNAAAVKKSGSMSEKSKGVLKTVVAVVVILAILVVIIGNSGIVQQKAVALNVGTEKVTAATFNYFYKDAYSSFVNSYGDYISYFLDTSKPLTEQNYSEDQTWAEYFTQQAISTATQVKTLCAAANEAGYTLSDDEAATLENQVSYLDSYATSAGYSSTKAYLAANYGMGCTIDSYTAYLHDNFLASSYAQKVVDDYTYTDDQLSAYYTENKHDLDTVDYRVFAVNAATAAEDETDFDDVAALEDAQAIADSMATQAQGDEQAFIDLALENSAEDAKETYKDSAATLNKNKTYSNCNTAFAEWLFDDTRVAGETTTVANSDTGFYVVMFLARGVNDYETVNVRHILVAPTSDDENATEYTDEQWAAAEEKAKTVYDEWKAGDATEDSFSALVAANSTDTGSNSNGGLYEGVYKGQMVAEFNDWCFDEPHEAGDNTMIKTSFGYHIIYFVGYGDTYWKTLADNGLRNSDYQAWYTDYSANYAATESSFGMFFTTK